MTDEIINVEHVSMKFRMTKDRVNSLKEYFVALMQHRISYEEFQVLDDISFKVRKGEVVGIVGKNGAGKSTLLKIIAGVLSPASGKVTVQGNIIPMLELGAGFDSELSGRENVFLNGAILGYSKEFLESKYDEILEFSELGTFIDMPIRNYSSGMMMRLAFSVATMVQPEILIVDEILSVGDAGFQSKSKARMIELMKGGATVFFVSHNIDQIEEMCDRVIWIENHKIRMDGDCQAVCDEYKRYWNH